MKISYLITCSNETDTLVRLLDIVGAVVKSSDDEAVILIDKDTVNNEKTIDILKQFASQMSYEIIEKKTCKIVENSLNSDYGAHKNVGINKCSGDYIFQIDGDECPSQYLIAENLHTLIENNPDTEAYAVPRINDFKGITNANAKQWGWVLSESPTLKCLRVNFPDHQWRIFKRDYPRIKFEKRLHEKIEGYIKYAILPPLEEYAIYHDKTIEKQIETNLRYNKIFTEEENRGHVS